MKWLNIYSKKAIEAWGCFFWKHWSECTLCCTDIDLWDFKETLGHSGSDRPDINDIFYGSGCKDFLWPNFALAHLFKEYSIPFKKNYLNSTIKRICYLVKMSFVYFFSIFLGKINALYWNREFGGLQSLPTLFPDRSS